MGKNTIVDRVRGWIGENKFEFLLLVLILLIGAFFRLYRIAGYMTFLGDEGRDAIVVRRLLVDFDPILIGPGTSIGNMYLGPLYYYLIAPSLLLANFSPVGPSAFVAAIGVATVWLVWWVGREWFSSEGALIAAFLYAISPTVVIFSKSSWNPNVMPFFALVTVYALWKVWYFSQVKWVLVMAVSWAFVLQSHYLGLLLAPVIGFFWLISLVRSRWGGDIRRFIIYSLLSFVVFLFLMSPLLIFDARHGWINFGAIKTFFTVRQTTVSARPWKAIPYMWPMFTEVVTRLVAGRNEIVGKWVALGSLSVLLWLGGIKRVYLESREREAFLLVISWLFVGLLGLGLYKQHIYDHYFGFFFPAPFLLLAGIIQDVIDKHKMRGWWLTILVVIVLTYFNILGSPLRHPPGQQLARTREIAGKIRDESGGSKFNLAVIAERNYEDAYQYFLERWGTGVTDIDPLNTKETITDQLFVVCEMPPEKCDPTHNPKAEVANFGWSGVSDEWQVWGVTIYKLVHTEGEK